VKNPKLHEFDLASIRPEASSLTDLDFDVSAVVLRPHAFFESIQSICTLNDLNVRLGHEPVPDAALAMAVDIPRLLGPLERERLVQQHPQGTGEAVR